MLGPTHCFLALLGIYLAQYKIHLAGSYLSSSGPRLEICGRIWFYSNKAKDFPIIPHNWVRQMDASKILETKGLKLAIVTKEGKKVL